MLYFIGLMSGTSLDGVDAALVDFSGRQPQLAGSYYHPYSAELITRLQAICYQQTIEFEALGRLDVELGLVFAECTKTLLSKTKLTPGDIRAIGSHGQTVYHSPNPPHPFTIQIGDPNQISKLTGIPVVADFRRADMAVGGQGAPLVPAFHHAVFQSAQENRVIVNIGGIANATILPRSSHQSVTGFDTGPGNTLIDLWSKRHCHKAFDENSELGRQGNICQSLLKLMLTDYYFNQSGPKSTGQEHFSAQWLDTILGKHDKAVSIADIQATLYELTATSIAASIQANMPATQRVLVCGGGTHNTLLMERLQANLTGTPVTTTESLGVHPDWVEAMAFAWFAQQYMQHKPGNLTGVTGAERGAVLGGLYQSD